MVILMLSFICASNNLEIYNKYLKASLAKQVNKNFEIILIDTSKDKYDSAASALNAGAEKACGDYFVFLHHDIVFENKYFTEELNLWVKSNDFYIAGVAGTANIDGKISIVSNIVHGCQKTTPGKKYTKTIECETFDECLFVVPKEVFKKRNFPKYIPTWHLYCVEYCLWVKQQNKKVLFMPLQLWHLSDGASMNMNYFDALYEIKKVYKTDIYTTMGNWPKSNLIMFFIVLKYKVKAFLGRI